MALTKKNDSTVPVSRAGLGLTLTSANQAQYPVSYGEDVWEIVTNGTQLAQMLSGSTSGSTVAGTYTSDEIDEAMAKAINDTNAKVDAAIGTGGSVSQQINAAINALDSNKSATATLNTQGNYTVSINQTDGKISSVSMTAPPYATSQNIREIFGL